MSEDDVDVMGVEGQGGPARVDRDRRAPRFSWTPAYEATFFRSLCESVNLGLRENSSFKAEAWERAAQALQATHGAYPAKSHLINKSDNARKRFRLWRGLREDPEFIYNPHARTVTATEEAWRAHIEKEPLSRALRGRPYEHEDFMEILYPDVIGSGGAPKRIMKPRRRTDGALGDDIEMPGTGVLNLAPEGQGSLASPSQQPRPTLSQTASGSSSGSFPAQPMQPPAMAPNLMPTPMASVSSGSGSALTPPDEIPGQSQSHNLARKRRQGPATGSVDETASPGLADTSTAFSPHKRRRMSSRDVQAGSSTSAQGGIGALGSSTVAQAATPFVEEILEAMKARALPRWREQALDMFFRDFAAEEYDLQVKISENVLSNEHKAMVFCKMPERVRQHWVSKFREMHQLNNRTT
ncbi:uncharacterized protein J7T54_002940 [Emericellopsis cladophorae]|uniref:Myb/SANT-like domain-containing protein n=1 Tax=Emericellopsis cladophorae TaxID=2686198 RepID=A0A9P9XUG9_9HYPO|nr:uncharacterized protein J7T54_002940 [Emericellopsis cladophorae]KAI6777629.1 hypothetical protein J7T54_002940 [Emericellopsis cladophorae]